MPHMVPSYYFGKMWVCVDDAQTKVPWEQFTRAEAEQHCDGEVELSEEGWFESASARGYMDAIPWGGPYPTESDARRMVASDGFHPDTGEEYGDIDIRPSDEEIEEDIAYEPLTEDQNYIGNSRMLFDSIMRERLRKGIAPHAGGDYYYQEPQRVTPKGPKTEHERMMDFFFPKRRGSLLSLKSWK